MELPLPHINTWKTEDKLTQSKKLLSATSRTFASWMPKLLFSYYIWTWEPGRWKSINIGFYIMTIKGIS